MDKLLLDALKQDIVLYSKKLWKQGFVAANDGNLSVLLDDNSLLITPTRTSKDDVTTDSLCRVDFEGSLTAGNAEPSSEVFMHIACYQQRSNVSAVVHAHPPYATALASTEHIYTIAENIILPELLITSGLPGVLDYYTPGSPELAKATKEHIAQHDVLLLKNHGVLTVGKDVAEAYARMESIEMYCKVLFLARQFGSEQYLSNTEVQHILDTYR